MTEYNVPLIRKTVAYIIENPQEWDQNSWASRKGCNTTMCFAGTACWLSGLDFAFSVIGPNDYSGADLIDDGSSIEENATELLGFTKAEAKEVFYSYITDPYDFKYMLEQLVGEEL